MKFAKIFNWSGDSWQEFCLYVRRVTLTGWLFLTLAMAHYAWYFTFDRQATWSVQALCWTHTLWTKKKPLIYKLISNNCFFCYLVNFRAAILLIRLPAFIGLLKSQTRFIPKVSSDVVTCSRLNQSINIHFCALIMAQPKLAGLMWGP